MKQNQVLSPEFELLLACLPYPLKEEEADRLRTLCRSDVDWRKFYRLVNRQGVFPPVYVNLDRHARAETPAYILMELKEQYRQNGLANMKAAAELVHLAVAFEQAGIPMVSLKGPVLSERLFNTVAMRTISDLDLCSYAVFLPQAHKLLRTLGYQRTAPASELTPRQLKHFTNVYHHITYYHADKNVLLELHWSLGNAAIFPEPLLHEFMDGCETISFFQARLKTLSPEDTLIYLLYHGATHKWARLKWILDIEQFLRSQIPLDWDRFISRAERFELVRPVTQGCFLANRLFKSSLPPQVEDLIEHEHHTLHLAENAQRALLADQDYTLQEGHGIRLQSLPYRMALFSQIKQKWGVIAELFHRYEDWELIPLPDFLFPLYILLRPILWFWRYYLKPR
jgi:hypothetical protein